jgi:hypothetical protein
VPEAEKIAAAFADNFKRADVGVYRFLCEITTPCRSRFPEAIAKAMATRR